MNANELATKYRGSPKIQELFGRGKALEVMKTIKDQEKCDITAAHEAMKILRGDPGRMFTAREVTDLIVQNAIGRLTLTDLERNAFRERNLI